MTTKRRISFYFPFRKLKYFLALTNLVLILIFPGLYHLLPEVTDNLSKYTLKISKTQQSFTEKGGGPQWG